ncbi:MAG: BMC domain-containing protein [Deltaproteobacteria bacterium]|nr:BMC domain-containing protein [Deltaproteobacteria bacterium]
MNEPAIGVIELNSLARGAVVTDVMTKRAPVRVLESHPICPGKFLIMVAGLVDDVKEAMAAGQHYGGYTMTDAVIIENLHPLVLPAIQGATPVPDIQAVGILETFASPACIVAADAACKAAEVNLIEVRLANGLGGKAFFTLTGELHAVEAAVEAGIRAVESGLLLRTEIIAAPHEQLKPTLY